MADTPTRLNKLIADSGLCSRREADRLIATGKVTVNGTPAPPTGMMIQPGKHQVKVNGKALPALSAVYLAFHKPKGVVTTRQDERNRDTIYQWLPAEYHHADPAGRLDRNSSGLLILSTDGAFLQRLTAPASGWLKHYRVMLDKPLTQADSRRLVSGLTIPGDDRRYAMVSVSPVETGVTAKRKPLYEMVLITGYNRQIRVSLTELGYDVISLKRIAFGPVKLGKLRLGGTRPLTASELRSLTPKPGPKQDAIPNQEGQGRLKKAKLSGKPQPKASPRRRN